MDDGFLRSHFSWIWGLENSGVPPCRLKCKGSEGLSDACLSMIIAQIIQIHNDSDLTEQKKPFMLSGSLFFLGGGQEALNVHSFPDRRGYIRKQE